MFLSSQRLPPIKSTSYLRSNISPSITPNNIYFKGRNKLTNFKKKIVPISNVTKIDNSDDIGLKLNTSSSNHSENEIINKENKNRNKKIFFFPSSVDKKY